MTEPSLTLQKTVIEKLKADSGVIALVPAAKIFDRHGLPTVSPCIILGDDQTIRDPISIDDDSYRVSLTMHVWSKGTNLVEAKKISGAIMVALSGRLWMAGGYVAAWFRVEQIRHLRDPSGEWAHAVLTFEAMLVEEEFA